MGSVTRRAAIGSAICGLASTAVVALPAIGAEDDPIHELIEDHRRLNAESVAVAIAVDELEERLSEDVMRQPRVATMPISRGKFARIEETDDYTILRHDKGERTGEYFYAVSIRDIERQSESIPEADRAAWMTNRIAAFRADVREQRAKQRACGYARLLDQRMAASEAAYAAGQNLLASAPVTVAGAIALMRYAIEAGENLMSEGDDAYTLLRSLVTSLEQGSVA